MVDSSKESGVQFGPLSSVCTGKRGAGTWAGGTLRTGGVTGTISEVTASWVDYLCSATGGESGAGCASTSTCAGKLTSVTGATSEC